MGYRFGGLCVVLVVALLCLTSASGGGVCVAEESSLAPPATPPLVTLQPILTRRAFAKALYQQFKLGNLPTSTYSVFMDVGTEDPDFAVLDAVFHYHLLQPTPQGLLQPDTPLQQIDAMMALAKLLFPMQKPSVEFVNQQLANTVIQGELDAYQRSRLALLLATGALPPFDANTPFRPQATIQQGWFETQLAQLQAQRLLIAERNEAIQQEEAMNRGLSKKGAQRFIPAGSTLVFSPQSPLRVDKLITGSLVVFTLQQPISINNDRSIPSGAEVHALLEETRIQSDEHTKTAVFRIEKVFDTQSEQSWFCQGQFERVFSTGANWMHPSSSYRPFWLSGESMSLTL